MVQAGTVAMRAHREQSGRAMAQESDRVTVTCRHGTHAGFRIGRAAAYEFQVRDDDPRERGHSIRAEFPDAIQRVFLLLDEHIQLNQPILETTYWNGWWYVDLVRITEDGNSIDVADRYIDMIVPPHAAPYRLLNLDEFGGAIEDGNLEREGLPRTCGGCNRSWTLIFTSASQA
jgi:hypothetical protein